mmetsp:Transcript_33594/g.33042  ORF Transcript_33594/g.33042 Transcript_33594/m.33042 type:complete len:123 (-) Transcript_33594:18-386(-)
MQIGILRSKRTIRCSNRRMNAHFIRKFDELCEIDEEIPENLQTDVIHEIKREKCETNLTERLKLLKTQLKSLKPHPPPQPPSFICAPPPKESMPSSSSSGTKYRKGMACPDQPLYSTRSMMT